MTCELVAYGIIIGLHSTYFVGPRCFVHFPMFFQLVNNKNNNDSNDKNNNSTHNSNDDDVIVLFGEWQASSLFLQSLHDTRNFKITYPYD